MDDLEALQMELALGSPGRPRKVAVEVVRALTEADIPQLIDRPSMPQTTLLKLRAPHHQLAQLLSKGVSHVEASAITGYTPETIHRYTKDPSFAELLAHYSEERKACFIDVVERMKTLGLTAIEELQERLNNEPEKWTKREMMELAELCIGKGVVQQQASAGKGPTGGAAVALSIKFVSAPQAPSAPSTPDVLEAVDVTYEDVEG